MPQGVKGFQKGNKLAKGGYRPGLGRNVELNAEELAIVREDWPLTVVTSFRIFKLWLTTPRKIDDPMWEGQSRQLDDAWKVINKWLPNAPQNVDVQVEGEITHIHGISPEMLEGIRRAKHQARQEKIIPQETLPTPLSLPSPVASINLTNGNGKSCPSPEEIASIQSKSLASVPTKSAKP